MAGNNTQQSGVSKERLSAEINDALKRLKENEHKLETEKIFEEDYDVRDILCKQLVGAVEEIRKESESQDGISLKDIENRFNSIKPNIDEVNSEIEEIIEKNVIIVPKIVEQTMDIVEKTAQIEKDIDNLRNRQELYTLVFNQNDQRMKQYQSEFNNLVGVLANTKKMEDEINKGGFRDIALIDREIQGINNQVSDIEGKINELNVFFDTIIQNDNEIKRSLNNYILDGSKVQMANVYNEIIENGSRAEGVPSQESVGHPLKEVVYVDNDYNVEKTSGEPATTADPKPVDDKEITTDKRLFNNYRAFVDYYKENGKRIEHDNIFTGRSETEKKEHNIYSQFYKKVDKPNDNPELLEVKEEDFDSELEESENIGLPPANKLKNADDPSTEGDELDRDQFKSPIRPELDPEIEINDFGTKVEDEERVDEGLLQDSNISQQGKTMTEQTTTPETLKDKQSEAVSGLYQGENNNDKDEIDYIYDTAIDKEKDKKLYTTRKDLGKAEDKPVPPKRVSNKEATSSNTSTGKMEEVAEDKKELSPEEITEFLEYNNKLPEEFNLQGNKTEKGSDGNPESHEVKVDDRNCSQNETLTEQTITPETQVPESPLVEVSLPKKMGFLKRMANRLKKIKVKDFKGFLKKKNKESEAHDVLKEENQSALPEVNLSLNQEQKDNAHYVLNAISDDVMQSKASNVPFIAEGQLLDEIVKELKKNKGEVYETFFEQKNNSTDAHKEIITNINRGKSADSSQSLSM